MERSNSYPSYSLQYCITLVERVYNTYGSTSYVSREDIAKATGKNDVYIQMPVSSSVQYGLLDRKSKLGYKPSDLFLRLAKPIDSNEEKVAQRESFLKPKLYSEIINQIGNNKFPSIAGLETILIRNHGISPSASKKAAAILYENIKNFGLLNDAGIISWDSLSIENTNEVEDDQINEIVDDSKINRQTSLSKRQNEPIDTFIENTDFRKIEIPLSEKKKAILMVPQNIKSRDLDIIKAQLEVIALSID